MMQNNSFVQDCSRVFISHQRSENSSAIVYNSPVNFCSFSERTSLFHNNSPVTLYYSPVTKILNGKPAGP